MNKLPPFRGVTNRPGTSKIGPVSTTRTIASAPAPSATMAGSDDKTFIDTFFTQVPVPGVEPPIIYNGDRVWAKVTLTLETAGPVAVGQQANISPVLSGKGQLLETDVPVSFAIAKGTRLYVASTSINRVKRVIEPLPWLENITGLVGQLVAALGASVAASRSKL